jgi:hypothetical protein
LAAVAASTTSSNVAPSGVSDVLVIVVEQHGLLGNNGKLVPQVSDFVVADIDPIAISSVGIIKTGQQADQCGFAAPVLRRRRAAVRVKPERDSARTWLRLVDDT